MWCRSCKININTIAKEKCLSEKVYMRPTHSRKVFKQVLTRTQWKQVWSDAQHYTLYTHRCVWERKISTVKIMTSLMMWEKLLHEMIGTSTHAEFSTTLRKLFRSTLMCATCFYRFKWMEYAQGSMNDLYARIGEVCIWNWCGELNNVWLIGE